MYALTKINETVMGDWLNGEETRGEETCYWVPTMCTILHAGHTEVNKTNPHGYAAYILVGEKGNKQKK